MLLLLLALTPLLAWVVESTATQASGVAGTINLFLLVILLTIVFGVVVLLLMHFFRRACMPVLVLRPPL